MVQLSKEQLVFVEKVPKLEGFLVASELQPDQILKKSVYSFLRHWFFVAKWNAAVSGLQRLETLKICQRIRFILLERCLEVNLGLPFFL